MKKIFLVLVLFLFAAPSGAAIKKRVQLNVPTVEQGKALCGPATIEMLFRFWGIDEYDQYEIAESILKQFPDSKRYKKSGILNTRPIDWGKYPGTGTINMREFLKRFAKTGNFMLEHESALKREKTKRRTELFGRIKKYVSEGVPVVVHQYWKQPRSRGHYRIVTGYDEYKRLVYLNDADGGKKLTQTYDEFLALWNVDRRWLHYNAIVFNIDRKRLDVDL